MLIVHCDIDQTYLQTDFHSIRGLLRVVTEKASDKRSFPYAKEVLSLLSQKKHIKLRFLSASPEQMRGVLQRKIQLDGIDYDDVFLKDATSMFKKGTFRGVLNQVSYKLPVLLESFLQTLQKNKLDVYHHLLFGDDSEDDPIIYSIFESIINKRINHRSLKLKTILEQCGVSENIIKKIQELTRRIQKNDYDTKIIAIIHMTGLRVVQNFLMFKEFLVPVFNWLQVSILLHELGVFSKEEHQEIIKTTAKFSIDGNHAALERVCSKESLKNYLDVEDANDIPYNNYEFYERRDVPLSEIIKTWRKQ